MRMTGLKRATRLSVVLTVIVLMSACDKTMANGDAGCMSYSTARSVMPRQELLPQGAWGEWIAATDTRMTGTCR